MVYHTCLCTTEPDLRNAYARKNIDTELTNFVSLNCTLQF